jgi:D-alanine--poly(phosphoribitol) ligase subunit 1
LTTRALSSEDFPAVRKIIFGGEGFPKPKLKQLYDLFVHRADLENVYGPTECTCICSAYTISNNDFIEMQQLAPLGTLAPNFDYEILPLDDDLHYGELFLLGPNVGLGYYNDLERMAKSFIQNPRHHLYREIGYKTGDIVYQDESGLLHFKGRADFQIKYMGYRIELEEIEAALNSLSVVNESAVIYHKLGEGLGQIIAYASLAIPESPEVLLQAIATILPSYMMPKRLLILDSLPKNQNGKVDRVSLQNFQSSKL